jgi:acid phosphatase class B
MHYILIVDVDGTINKMGQKFDEAKVETVAPMMLAKDILDQFHRSGGKIFYLTGRRRAELKAATDAWMAKYKFPSADSIVYYTARYGAWSWDNYYRFKRTEIEKIIKKHPGLVPVVIDDNESVLSFSKAAGCKTFRITKEQDWASFQDLVFGQDEPAISQSPFLS